MTKMIRNKKNKVAVFSTLDLLNEEAAALLIDLAKKSIEERGRFVLCLSGGNTPKKLYDLLAQNPYRDLPLWKNTFIFWSDERCVALSDERNNAHIASTTLLKKIEIPASHIFPIPVELPPVEAARKYEERLHVFFENDEPVFDLMLLGLGENGHTASLFPGTSVLHEKTRWVKEVLLEDGVAGVPNRITLTAPLINKSRQILFLVTGEEKSFILETVLTASYLPEKYPAQLIDPEHGEVEWFIDEKAATHLTTETH